MPSVHGTARAACGMYTGTNSEGVVMKCPKCGADMADNAKFCSSCGKKVQAGKTSGQANTASAAGDTANGSSGCLGSLVLIVATALICMAVFQVGPFEPSSSTPPSASSSLPQDTRTDAVLVLADDVPDPAFRSYLAEHADTDSDGALSREEADAVTELGSRSGDEGLSGLGISDLTGIEHLTNITTLVCSNNTIVNLDLTQNIHLEQVVCDNNQMTTLVLPACDTLTSLHCTGNKLSELDLTPCPGLTDIQVDAGTSITAGSFDDAAAKTAVEDMALIYSVSATPLVTSPAPTGEVLLTPGQDPELDTSLIYGIVYPEVYQQRSNLSTTGGAYDLSYDIPDVGGSYFVYEETARKIIRSFYGTCPDDLGYIGSNGVRRDGTGWTVLTASGPFARTIESSDWSSFGQMVTCEVAVSYSDGLEDSATYRYRVTAQRDAESVFGYHLVSLYALDGKAADTSNGGAATTTGGNTAVASTGDIDYHDYMFQELARLGLAPAGCVVSFEEETSRILTAHVYEEHDTHTATLGWYTLDKETLAITDDILGGSVYE